MCPGAFWKSDNPLNSAAGQADTGDEPPRLISQENDVNCSDCGTTLTDQARFCSSCGAASTPEVSPAVPAADHKVRKALILGVALAFVVFGVGTTALALTGGEETYEQCMAEPTTTYYDCKDLKQESSTEQSDAEDSSSDSEEYSDSEGYYEQPRYSPPPTAPKQCLQWRTDYRTVPGRPSQFGQPINPSYQVPSGQTCVRYG
jgi:hypothetical protein